MKNNNIMISGEINNNSTNNNLVNGLLFSSSLINNHPYKILNLDSLNPTINLNITNGNTITFINPNPKDKCFKAAKKGEVYTVRELLNAYSDVINDYNKEYPHLDVINDDGDTLLITACKNKRFELAKALIEDGADINLRNLGGQTALSIAIELRDNELITLLLFHKANTSNLNLDPLEHTFFNDFIKSLNSSIKFEFFQATKEGQMDKVRNLLEIYLNINTEAEKDINLNSINDDGDTLLMIACKHKNNKFVKVLIEGGADINLKNSNGQSALSVAIESCDNELITLLLFHKANTSNLNLSTRGQTFFNDFIEFFNISIKNKCFQAAKEGQIDEVRNFLEIYSNVNTEAEKHALLDIVNDKGDTLLITACKNKRFELAEALIKDGADISLKNPSGQSAMSLAIEFYNMDLITLLFSLKANISELKLNSSGHIIKDICFQYARDGEIYDVRNLLKAYSNVNVKAEEYMDLNVLNDDGDTLLITACKNKRFELAKALIEDGADINLKNSSGQSALSISIESGNIELITLLLSLNADACNLDLSIPGQTFFNNFIKDKCFQAAKNGEINKFRSLLKIYSNLNDEAKKYTDLDVTNDEGDTPLIVACKNAKFEFAKALIKDGAKVNLKSLSGQSALSIAIEFSNVELITILLSSKADICNLNLSISGRIFFNDFIKGKCFQAAKQGAINLVEVLFKMYSDINAEAGRHVNLNVIDDEGDTLLMTACKNKRFELAKVLIENGAEIKLKNPSGQSALSIAIDSQNIELVTLLIFLNADTYNLKLTPSGQTFFECFNNLINFPEKLDLSQSKLPIVSIFHNVMNVINIQDMKNVFLNVKKKCEDAKQLILMFKGILNLTNSTSSSNKNYTKEFSEFLYLKLVVDKELLMPFGFIYDKDNIAKSCDEVLVQIEFFNSIIYFGPDTYYKIMLNIMTSKGSLDKNNEKIAGQFIKIIKDNYDLSGDGFAGLKYALNNLLELFNFKSESHQDISSQEKLELLTNKIFLKQQKEWDKQKIALTDKILSKNIFTWIQEIKDFWNTETEFYLSPDQAKEIRNTVELIKNLASKDTTIQSQLQFLDDIIQHINNPNLYTEEMLDESVASDAYAITDRSETLGKTEDDLESYD